jgi:hypothetical protein
LDFYINKHFPCFGNRKQNEENKKALELQYSKEDINFTTYLSKINLSGAKII